MADARVTGSFAATGASLPIFVNARPDMPKQFNVSVWGAFVGTVTLQRSFDDGATWVDCSRDSAGTTASWTAPFSVVVEEGEPEVLYRLNATALSSGAANYRMSQ